MRSDSLDSSVGFGGGCGQVRAAVLLALAAVAIIALVVVMVGRGGALLGAPTVSPANGAAEQEPPPPARTPIDSAPERRARAAESTPKPPVKVTVVDAETGAPLPDTGVRAVPGGARLGRTAADGSIDLGSRSWADVAFVHAGYLLRWPGAQGEPWPSDGRVTMTRDRFTVAVAVRFVGSDGAPPERVRFRLGYEGEDPRDAARVPGVAAPDASLRARWLAHLLVAGLPGFSDLGEQLGVRDADRIFEAPPVASVHVLTPGPYRLQAVSDAGEVANVTVIAGAQGEPRIGLRPGAWLRGTVADARDGTPVAGATVDPLQAFVGLTAETTDHDGGFALGPVPAMPLALWVEHPDYQPRSVGERMPGGAPITVKLVARARGVVAGQVRSWPMLLALADASVLLQRKGAVLARTVTDRAGAFRLQASDGDAELVIEAEGYQRYVEVVDVVDAPATYDLLPDDRASRLRVGLTALVRGRVVDAAGMPAAGVQVQAITTSSLGLEHLAGRRVREGGMLALPNLVEADASGHFEIECLAPDTVRLQPLLGSAAAGAAVSVELAAGSIHDDVVLRLAR